MITHCVSKYIDVYVQCMSCNVVALIILKQLSKCRIVPVHFQLIRDYMQLMTVSDIKWPFEIDYII